MKVSNIKLLAMIGMMVAASQSAQATFHFMQIQKVIGGVNGNTDAQAIQLRMRLVGQNFLNGQARLVAYDATGTNPVIITSFPPPDPAGGSCREILIASDDFALETTPAAARDYAMNNLIPPSYFAAGSLTFENSTGTIVYWRISWGGDSYTGPTTGDIANDGDGEFGSPVLGQLPSTDLNALEYISPCPPGTSASNDVDYALTVDGADFTNNSGDNFDVTGPPIPALSQWGLIAMTLLTLCVGTLVYRHRVNAAAA